MVLLTVRCNGDYGKEASMPQTTSEMAAILSVILGKEGDRATDGQEITDPDCEPMLSVIAQT
jgi:hypothetical protein